MPKIVISGISEEVVRTVAPRLIPAVAEALACPVEWISLNMYPLYTLRQRQTRSAAPWWRSTGSSDLWN